MDRSEKLHHMIICRLHLNHGLIQATIFEDLREKVHWGSPFLFLEYTLLSDKIDHENDFPKSEMILT